MKLGVASLCYNSGEFKGKIDIELQPVPKNADTAGNYFQMGVLSYKLLVGIDRPHQCSVPFGDPTFAGHRHVKGTYAQPPRRHSCPINTSI